MFNLENELFKLVDAEFINNIDMEFISSINFELMINLDMTFINSINSMHKQLVAFSDQVEKRLNKIALIRRINVAALIHLNILNTSMTEDGEGMKTNEIDVAKAIYDYL